MKSVSFRIDKDKLKMLDVIAKAEHTDRSTVLNNLVAEKIDLYTWQLERIEKGISQGG